MFDPMVSVKACWLLVSSTAQSPKEKNKPKQMCQVARSLSLLKANPMVPRATMAINAGKLQASKKLSKLQLLLAPNLIPKFLALQHTDRQILLALKRLIQLWQSGQR